MPRRCPVVLALVFALASLRAHAQQPQLGSLLFVPSDIYNTTDAAPPVLDAAAAQNAFEQARQAVADGRVSDAFRHASAAVTLDPNHADARRLLGYQRVGDAWAGGYAQRMLATGNTWSREFGWVRSKDLPRYEEGRRPARGRWVTPEDDARLHDTIDRGWAIRTDHFLVTTNIDRAAGVELAIRLETLFQLWRQLFGEFAATADELQARLDGKETAGYLRKPFRVRYHRSRAEYNDALRRQQPQIETTLGIYFDATRESHFFAGPDQDPGTIAHEAVHQFFYESAPRPARRLATVANVWAVEGVACYFESLQPKGASAFTIGAPDAGRLQAARYRRVVDGYYVPLAELSALGLTDLQERPDLPRLYSQSAGLASFLIDGVNGGHRDAFRELLAAIYAGRDAADTLEQAAGVPFEQLDREYAEYMQGLPVTAVITP
jgi:hypothetical protein